MESNKINNKTLRTQYKTYNCVIVAKHDGVTKYISKSFPNLFQYTVKLQDAYVFKCAYDAETFIEYFCDTKFKIIDPKIIVVIHTHKLDSNPYI